MDVSAWSMANNARIEPLGDGLINQTYGVWDAAGPLKAILQRLNTDIFSPLVHEDIEAVTAHLADKGLPTTRLIRTDVGNLWFTDDAGGAWRMLTPIGDRTISRLDSSADAQEAGALVARVHSALEDFQWEFRSVRPGAHDTARHMDLLMGAVDRHRKHRLWWDVANASETIAEGWRTWTGADVLPRRVIHGDLKISNLRFTGPAATALVDLDTLQWSSLDIELGDAMRSWCNPAAENTRDTHFDVEIFEAAMAGYREGSGECGPTEAEWASIIPGLERICWELAARFATDALEETYFGWDPSYGTRGDHNLLRAQGQISLAKSVRHQRSDAEAALKRARS
jgi:Ser/Thr protein kinase RdoA (MazF antagonist)